MPSTVPLPLRPQPGRRTRLVLAATALVLLAGCSATSSGTSATPNGAGGANPQPAAAGDVAKAAAGAASAAPAPAATAVEHQVVYTAQLEMSVKDVQAAVDRAEAAATAAGGLVADEHTDAAAGSGGTATMTLQVPPDRNRALIRTLQGLGTRVSSTERAQDVTAQSVDLTSRLATQQASVARIRALLDRATTIGQIVTIEGELTRREADLESIEAQRKALGAQVALATVSVTFYGPSAAPVRAVHPVGFGRGLHAGWHAFTSSARAVAAVAGAALPFVPLLLLAAVGGVVLRRRRGLHRPAVAAPTAEV